MNFKSPKLGIMELWIMMLMMILVACNPTITEQRTPSMTETITASATVTKPAATITPILGPLPTLTPTPLPTLTTEEVEDHVRELLRTNGGCELPCWWGISPGSRWDLTMDYLNTFALEILTFPKEDGNIVYWVSIPVPDDVVAGGKFAARFYVSDSIIDLIEVPKLIMLPGIENKTIQNILAVYGPPTEVWLEFAGELPGGYTDYSIALNYPEEGTIFTYYSKGITVISNNSKYLRMCASELDKDSLVLWLFSPQTSLSFPDIENVVYPYDFVYGRISEFSNMNEETFFDLFSTDPKACFETPYDLWPIYPTAEP